MWHALFSNFSQIAVLIIGLQLIGDRFGDIRSPVGKLAFGGVCGSVACISMALASPILQGFLFDLRGPLVACAVFFGGWVAAIGAVSLTIIMRIYLGGTGMAAGILGIVAIAMAALALHHVLKARNLTISILAGVAVTTTVANLFGYALVPREQIAAVLQASFLPLTVSNFAATLILVALINRENQRTELQAQNNIYRQMVDALPDCMNAKDSEGRFIAANPATAKLMGVASPENLIGHTDAEYYATDESETFQKIEREVMVTAERQVIDQRIVIEGRKPLTVSTQKIPLVSTDGHVRGVITHNRDVTADRELAAMKSQFISTVSHELRTPLTALRGSLAMINSCSLDALPPSVCQLQDIAYRNSERLAHLIDDLLDVESLQQGGLTLELERHPLAPIIEATLASLANYMPSQDVRIEFVDEAPGAIANVEPGRLEQVLANLVSNAVKFSEKGGTATVRMARRGGKIILSVSDRGQGIPEAFRHRIFMAFEQADGSDKKAKSGTGLGLHIAKVMVEKMNGDVRFSSEEGKGTTFYVELPDRTDDADSFPADPRRAAVA